jgi:hypothetical protein
MGFATIALGMALHTGSTKKDFTKLEWSKKVTVSKDAVSTYKGGKYCGPGWGFTYKDILDGKIRQLPGAVDAIDEACKLHDYCYEENGYFTQGCNLVLTYDLVGVVINTGSTPQQRLDAVLMAAVFFIESQTVDLAVLAKDKMIELRNRLEGVLATSTMTLEQAITNELLRGR